MLANKKNAGKELIILHLLAYSNRKHLYIDPIYHLLGTFVSCINEILECSNNNDEPADDFLIYTEIDF